MDANRLIRVPAGTTGSTVESGNVRSLQSAKSVFLSVLIPVYNEEDNVQPLFAALFPVLERMGCSFEIIAVNDGSRDGSMNALRQVAANRRELKLVSFRRNAGQTAAIMAGIDHASGEVLISMDADLQNDPEDIPRLIEKLDEGFDVVSGWRKDRKD